MQGAVWRIAGQAARIAIQLGSLCYLSRILSPHDFGIASLGLVLIGIGQLFVVSGPASAIIQAPQLIAEDVARFIAANAAIAFAFTCAIILASYLMASSSDIFYVFTTLAIAFFISALSIGPLALLQRALRFRFLAIADTCVYLFANATLVIALAHVGYGAMSLAIGQACYAALFAALVFWAAPIRCMPRWDNIRTISYIQRFGLSVSIAELLFYLLASIDVLLVGYYMGTNEVGFYSRALYLVRTPTNALLVSVHTVLFAVIARARAGTKEIERTPDFYARMMSLFLTILTPWALFLCVFAFPLIHVLFGGDWTETARLVQVFSFLLLTTTSTLGDAVLKATDHVRLQILYRAAVLCISTIITIIALPYGLKMVAYANLLSSLSLAVSVHLLASRIVNLPASRQNGLFRPFIIMSVITAATLLGLHALLKHTYLPAFAQVTCGAIATLVATGAVLSIPDSTIRTIRNDAIAAVRQLRTKRSHPYVHFNSIP